MRADRQLALERSQADAYGWCQLVLRLSCPPGRHGGGELRAWLNEAESASHYSSRLWTSYTERSLPNPDGIGTWAENGQARRLRSPGRGPGRRGGGLPPLLFCFPGPGREQVARRAVAGCRDAPDVRIATAALDSA